MRNIAEENDPKLRDGVAKAQQTYIDSARNEIHASLAICYILESRGSEIICSEFSPCVQGHRILPKARTLQTNQSKDFRTLSIVPNLNFRKLEAERDEREDRSY